MSDQSPGSGSPRWRRYLRFWRQDVDADVREEIDFHIEGIVAQHVAAGVPDAEARRMAEERFGNTDEIARRMRELAHFREASMRRTEWVDSVMQDIRYGVRQLIK